MNSSNKLLRVVRVSDSNLDYYLSDVCRVHSAAYPKGHFSNLLGAADLLNYYRELIENSDISLVAENEGGIVGFLIAGTHISRGVANFTRNNRGLLMRILLLHPTMAVEKLMMVISSHLFKAEKSRATFRMMSIAVDPKAMRSGIGAELINELEKLLVASGVDLIGLSVRKSNAAAIDFYDRIGFSKEMQNHWAYYFIKEIGPGGKKSRSRTA